MKYLVTGGAGFIGSALCRWLHSNSDCNIVNIDKLTYAGTIASLGDLPRSRRYRFHRQDICDRSKLAVIVAAERPDVIIHLAAESHVDRSIDGAAAFIETNVLGTYSLLEAARAYWTTLDARRREAFRFLHVSTDEVFGSLGDHGAFDEASAYAPRSPYAATKASADHLVRAWRHTYDLPTMVSHCSNNYGPYHFPEKFIPLLITNAIESRPLPVYGDGRNVRDWLYVDDHAEALAIIAARGKPGETYAIGGRSERTNLEVAEAVCRELDALAPRLDGRPHRTMIEMTEDRPGHDYRYAIDPARIHARLGWQARETFESGLRKTVSWFLRNDDWWRPLRRTIYGGERLGLRVGAPVRAGTGT
ncbi:MAG TPA: dTDP-glucose 4,6-dehydratase [Aestuariivirgaceae bacterium]|nr:dTDP-glucose 4,6-dehydratase [Aestuariivirgaceae bacterium]